MMLERGARRENMILLPNAEGGGGKKDACAGENFPSRGNRYKVCARVGRKGEGKGKGVTKFFFLSKKRTSKTKSLLVPGGIQGAQGKEKRPWSSGRKQK